MSEKVYEMTREGIEELEAELLHKSTVVAPEIAERLKEARSLGDLSENSEYDEAKEAQANNQRRISEIENILKYVKEISEDTVDDGKIGLGTKVSVRGITTEEDYEFKMVTSHESDFLQGKLSVESPLGEALMGKEEGDIVKVNAPMGIMEYEVLSINKSTGN